MSKRLLHTAHFWAQQLGVGDKEVRAVLEDREPDGHRGTQPTFYLTTVYQALAETSGLNAGHERARKDKEAADKLALENAETRGEIARIPELVERFGRHVMRCCTRLDQIPDALGQLVDPAVAAVVVKECRRLIYEARIELAADTAEGVAADSESVAAAANGNGERVGRRKSNPIAREQRGAGTVED